MLAPALPEVEMATELCLTCGDAAVYTMDIFHAERRTHASNYRMTTTIDCFQPTDVPR